MSGGLIDGDPQRLGGYWLAGRLGAGGQGVVYEAYDAGGRRVAIKVLHGDAGTDAELRHRFGREAAAARKVASFCTAGVIDADLDGARPYIVSEYVEGPSLRRAVNEGRLFGGGDLHRLATAIATALTAIHDAEVIHRDLKPDNVLLGPDGPRVIDFGVARTADMSLTATGVVSGTPTYMAPEVFTGERAGTAADVFAWGGIVLFAATGADPFQAETLGAVMHRVLSVQPRLDALPEMLRPLVAAALAKDPQTRPTARDLLLALTSQDGRLDTSRLLMAGSDAGALVRADSADPGLGVLAEDSYAALGPAERELAPELFLRLVTVTQDGQQIPRRARWAELLDGRPEHEAAGIRRLVETFAYLIAHDEEELWLSRPALPLAWPRLRQWVRANWDGLAAHRDILAAAWRWHAQGRQVGDLFQGGTLESAMSWAATGRRNITLSAVERDFLEAGVALTRRRARRSRLVASALAVLLVTALVAGAIAVRQSRMADERAVTIAAQRDEAQARQLAATAESLRVSDPVRAMLLSVAAWRLDPDVVEARAALTGSLSRREIAAFRDPSTSVRTVRALSRDGRILASASEGRVRLWDVRSGRQITSFSGVDDDLRQIVLGPGGRLLVTVGREEIRSWDVATGRPHGPARVYPGQADLDLGVSFGHSEDWVAVYGGQGLSGVLHTGTGEARETSASVLGTYADISSDGRHLVTGGFQSRPAIVDLGTLRATPLGADCQCSSPVAYSPDGRTVALGKAKRVELYDTATGAMTAHLSGRGDGGPLRFSADGRFLTAVDSAGDIRIWRLEDRRLLLTHRTGTEERPSTAFDPDGHTLRYLVEDGVTALDLSSVTGAATRGRALPGEAVLSPDWRLAAVKEYGESRVQLLDAHERTPVATLELGKGTTDEFATMVFSGDGRRLVVSAGTTGEITVWDTATFRRLAVLSAGEELAVGALAVDVTGTMVAAQISGFIDEPMRGEVRLWEVPGGRQRWVRREQDSDEMVFTPDGRALAVTFGDRRLLDTSTGAPYGPPVSMRSSSLTFDRTGSRFAVIDSVGRVSVWGTGSRRRMGPVIRVRVEEDVEASAAFSPAGDVIAVMSGPRTVGLWHIATGRRLGGALAVGSGELVGMTFTADGSRLVTLDRDGTRIEHPVDPEPVAAAVCARAGRTLTPDEWRTHLPGLAYRDVCAVRR
ncbi:protein kinase [Planomonospora sp. ID67723]|uniref:serine/threonine-protein kinase n=1 Tax=Planomonospora sp. ID67723 TaxID=2738134 RepID=UPI0018C3DB57|nr:serine/threonine-protein kinase [Planomonospora sp. ID67723]MBG0827350.1 protein kinase [Planomonospora sp. ID67723]